MLRLFDSVPEYALATGQATEKVDVYGLGIVFEEIVGKKKAVLSQAVQNKLQLILSSMITENQNETIEL